MIMIMIMIIIILMMIIIIMIIIILILNHDDDDDDLPWTNHQPREAFFTLKMNRWCSLEKASKKAFERM